LGAVDQVDGMVNQTIISTGIQGIGLNTYAYDQLLVLVNNYGNMTFNQTSLYSSMVCNSAGTYCTIYGGGCSQWDDLL